MRSCTGKYFLELEVNGRTVSVAAKPSDTLLHVLREKLGLTGAKPGCENGDCGACTVLVDGMPVKSCLMLAAEAVGRAVTTVEGLKDAPIQTAFVEQWGIPVRLLHLRLPHGLPRPGAPPSGRRRRPD